MSPELFEKWEHIVEDVDKTRIPVEFIKKLIVKLDGRRQRTINVKNFFKRGMEPDDVEAVIADTLEKLDDEMVSIEFILDIENIAETVQPETDKILKGL
jgi:acid phosphatase class B